jgi:hypothetical protein
MKVRLIFALSVSIVAQMPGKKTDAFHHWQLLHREKYRENRGGFRFWIVSESLAQRLPIEKSCDRNESQKRIKGYRVDRLGV